MEAHTALESQLRVSLVRDEGLARLIGNGSERAFAALYHRYHQHLYRYCRSMLRDDADAQDALQSTFAAAFAALRDGRRDAPLRPWLFRIAHNEAISIMRRRRPVSELPDGLPAQTAATEEQAENHERLRRLVADMRELPERQRAALLMRELSGLSHDEIAVALETTVGAAKQTIFEARQTLAEFEAGRMASCTEICRTISNGDRRALRGRKVRAHLRDCAACAAFAGAIPARSADLRALSPALPPAMTGLLLSQALRAGASRSGGGGGGALGAGAAGKTTLLLGGAKVATTVAVAATATLGVTAAFKSRHGALVVPVRPAGSSAVAHHAVPRGPSTRARVSNAGAVWRGVSSRSALGAARPASAQRQSSLSVTTRSAPGRHATSPSRSAAVVSTTPAAAAAASSPAHGRGATNGAAHQPSQSSRGQGQGHGSPPGRDGSPPPGRTKAPGPLRSAKGAPARVLGNQNANPLGNQNAHALGNQKVHALGNPDTPGLAVASSHRKST